MAIKAQFKTGKDQRIVPVYVKVATTLELGDAVTLDVSKNEIAAAASGAAATHIIALTDETVGGNYKVFPASIQEAAALNSTVFNKVAASTETEKKVGLYPIFDKDDIIFSEV